MLAWLPGYGALKVRYDHAAATLAAASCPYEHYLTSLNTRVNITPIDLRRIPRSGPLIVVANHPFGGLDGLMLGAVLSRVRPDVKLLGNQLLAHIAGLSAGILPVDVLKGEAATTGNSRSLRMAINWVRSGGCLGVFPAGEVSRFRLKSLSISDRAWGRHVGALIRLTQATVLPLYFPGRNSLLFTVASILSAGLGTVLLPRELMRQQNQSCRVIVGRARPWSALSAIGDDGDIMQHLRRQTYFLSHRRFSSDVRRHFSLKPRQPASPCKTVIPAITPKCLREEIQSLPPDQCLVRQGRFSVFHARACQIPNVLQEIARLREITFREVGEGTGQSMDLDRYDAHYRHLFLWNHEHSELAGAYRLGLTDQIMDSHGQEGLYTSSLFRFHPRLIGELTPAIELGRAFVCSAYQRHHTCLFLLWHGIGRFIVRYPRYHKLFGPVSISQEYQKFSRDVMIRYLRANKMNQRLAHLVKPRQPVKISSHSVFKSRGIKPLCQAPEDIAILVSELEEDGKGLPVLLRHYLKLDATLLSFNRDKAFSNVIDGLVFLDLTQTTSPMVRRVMGTEGYRQFCEYHQLCHHPGVRKAG